MFSPEMHALGTARSAIRELFEYGKARAAAVGPERVYDFSIGNPNVPPPPEVRETMLELLSGADADLLHGYTSAQGDPAAREAIAADLNRRFGADCTADRLYLTAGAAAALCCCFRALCNAGDEFILLAPYFPEYQVFIASAGGRAVVVPACSDTFQIDLTALESAIGPRTKAVVVNAPNNPTGVVYTEETLSRLADLLTRKSAELGRTIFLISDEPYREIIYDGVTHTWIPSLYPDTLVCYSYSKSLSLPGERIGYVLTPARPDLYAAIAGAGRSLGYVNAPALFQRVAAACTNLTADLSIYAANRRLLLSALREMGFVCPEPKGAFYLFPQALETDAVAFSRNAMELDLLLVPGDSFGCPGHVRISYCVPTERIERALPVFHRLAALYR